MRLRLEPRTSSYPQVRIESKERHFTGEARAGYRTAEDFANLVITRGEDGYLVKLGMSRGWKLGSEEERIMFRGNKRGDDRLGVSKQSTANTLEVARAVNALVDKINPTLPAGMSIKRSYDSSVFIEASIKEVYQTLFTAMVLVIIVIYLFRRCARHVDPLDHCAGVFAGHMAVCAWLYHQSLDLVGDDPPSAW